MKSQLMEITQSNLKIVACNFYRNIAREASGGIKVNQSYLEISSSKFDNNLDSILNGKTVGELMDEYATEEDKEEI